MLSIAKGDPWLITVVDDDQLEPFALARTYQSGVDLARKRAVLSLRGIADAEALTRSNFRHNPISALIYLLHEAAMMERVQQPEAHPLPIPGSLDDVAKAEHLAGRL